MLGPLLRNRRVFCLFPDFLPIQRIVAKSYISGPTFLRFQNELKANMNLERTEAKIQVGYEI